MMWTRVQDRSTAFLKMLFAFAAIFSFAMLGCGGGGGGGGGDSNPSLAYSGLTTPAEITATNADAIALGAMESGASTTSMGGIATLQGSGQITEPPDQPFLMEVSALLEGAMDKLDFDTEPEASVAAAMQSQSSTINGACGGSAFYNISVDTGSGAFSGSMRFDGYCEDGMSLEGNTSFSGILNLGTGELRSFIFSFDYLTGSSDAGSVTMDGRMRYIVNGLDLDVAVDMLIRDNGSRRVCKIENYDLYIREISGEYRVDVSGRFYDPDYGYVDLMTTAMLHFTIGDQYPYTGVLVVTGADGASGPTALMLTAVSATQCRVQADTDGDGAYDDYDTDIILWVDL